MCSSLERSAKKESIMTRSELLYLYVESVKKCIKRRKQSELDGELAICVEETLEDILHEFNCMLKDFDRDEVRLQYNLSQIWGM